MSSGHAGRTRLAALEELEAAERKLRLPRRLGEGACRGWEA